MVLNCIITIALYAIFLCVFIIIYRIRILTVKLKGLAIIIKISLVILCKLDQ